MRVFTNEQRLKRSRQFAQVLFILSLVILFGGLILNSVLGNSTLFIFVPCIIMPVGLITTIYSVRLTNIFVRLPHPEDAIHDGIKGIGESTLYNYLPPATHILVAPQGVYTLTIRYQQTRFTIQGDQVLDARRKGPLGPIVLFLKQEGVGDPFKDADKDADAVQKIIEAVLPDALDVQPVVVLTSPKADLVIENSKYPVVFADSKKKPSLKRLLREDKRRGDVEPLTVAEMEKIHEALIALLPVSQRTAQLIEDEA